MSEEKADRELYDLIYEAMIPAGHRPETDEEIEAMLEGCAGDELPQEQFNRMLRKIRGQEEIGIRETDDISLIESQLTEEQQELVALHRAEGKELPPEIQALLEKLRMEAKAQRNEDRGDGKRA
jgi:hypothetical protein